MAGMHEFMNLVGVAVGKQTEGLLQFAYGEVDEYDEKHCTVTVHLKGAEQPIATGDIPYVQPWVAGEGGGMQAGPEKGTLVLVIAFDQEWEHLVALPALYSEKMKPPGAPRGDWWVVHKFKETYVKLVTEGARLLLGGKEYVKITAPKVDLNDELTDLGNDERIVRWKDLKPVVDTLNDLKAWCAGHKHTGNMGGPTPLFPDDAASILLILDAVANASDLGRVK